MIINVTDDERRLLVLAMEHLRDLRVKEYYFHSNADSQLAVVEACREAANSVDDLLAKLEA